MGKFISKITPKSDPTRNLDIANKKISRKVLYRRLQSPQPYYSKPSPGVFDLIAYNWPYVVAGVLLYIVIKQDSVEHERPDEKIALLCEKSLYDMARERYLEYKNERKS